MLCYLFDIMFLICNYSIKIYSQNVPIVFNSGPLLLFRLFFLTSTVGIASNLVGFRMISLFAFWEVLPVESIMIKY